MVAISDNGKCNPFLSLWPRLTQTSFFPPTLSLLCHLPSSALYFYLNSCLLFYVRLLFVFYASSLPLSFRQIWSELAVILKSQDVNTLSQIKSCHYLWKQRRYFTLWLITVEYLQNTFYNTFFLFIELFLFLLVKTYRNCNCNFFVMPMHTEALASRLCTFKTELINTADD